MRQLLIARSLGLNHRRLDTGPEQRSLQFWGDSSEDRRCRNTVLNTNDAPTGRSLLPALLVASVVSSLIYEEAA